MKTLAQIRAANALKAAKQPNMGIGQKGGDALSSFPMLIITDGLLATLAYAVERKPDGQRKNPGALLVANAIAEHLSSPGIRIVKASDADSLVEELANADSATIRRATSETLAFLNYLKRFTA